VSGIVSWAKLDAARVTYYENSVAAGRESYYSGQGEAPGQWTGEGARHLGLDGEVAAGALQRMALGQHPASGDRLRETLGVSNGRQVQALDFTFSAPKSVSLLYTSGDHDLAGRMLDAHERAVRAALGVLERDAAFVRRGKGGTIRHHADGLIVACYRHRTSRAGDPQLHTHAVVANWARGPDGRYTALYTQRLLSYKMVLGAIYAAQLRANLAEAGLAWRPLSATGLAELDCVDPATLRDFSTRRAEIERVANGSTESARAMAGATLTTRRAKREVHMPAVERKVAAALGPELLDTLREQTTATRTMSATADLDLDWLAGPKGLTMMRNTFDRDDVLIAIARSAAQGIHTPDLVAETDRFLTRPDVIALDGGRYTTQDLILAERARESAQLGRADARVAIASEKALRDGVRGLSLNDEQETVVRSVFRSGNGVDLIEAQAGTGKTYTAAAIRRVAEADGCRVLGCSPTARAARELEAQAGIESSTLDSFVRRLDRGEVTLAPRDVVVVDEAGMAGTRLAARLEAHAAHADAKVIEIGDRRQLQSVLAGGELQGAHLALGGLELREVVRQRAAEDRRVLGRLHAGDVDAWIGYQERSERLHYDATLDHAVDAYMRHAEQLGADQLAFVCPTNAMAQAANDLVRERLGRTRPLEDGDRVVCRLNDRHLQVNNGDRATVMRVHGAGCDIELDDGRRRSIPRTYIEAGSLQLGYAQTVHTAQGATVERTVIAAHPDELYAELAYVAATRARGTTELYLIDGAGRGQDRAEIGPVSSERVRDQRGDLARAMNTSRADVLAIEQLPDRRLERGAGLEL
jgi:conjugative relaxase-like TrwC/TraI family protein